MVRDPVAFRRWFGGIVLVLALGMLICGETVLKGKLQSFAFILYWTACMGFTGLAIIVALVDARALRQHSRKAQRDLFESTLKEIERQARNRSGRSDGRKKRS